MRDVDRTSSKATTDAGGDWGRQALRGADGQRLCGPIRLALIEEIKEWNEAYKAFLGKRKTERGLASYYLK